MILEKLGTSNDIHISRIHSTFSFLVLLDLFLLQECGVLSRSYKNMEKKDHFCFGLGKIMPDLSL